MRNYRVEKGAGIEGLRLEERDEPVPGPGEVLVRVRATSLNAREPMILAGLYPLPIKPNLIPVSDGAGEVVALGDGVTRVAVGDRVAASIFPKWIDGRFGWPYAPQIGGSLDGMLTEYAVLSEEALVHLPDHLSYEEGATLPCAAVTAWNALCGGRRLLPGETVLTQGSGGVSLFALQLAQLFGARVIATTSSEEKARRLTAKGAEHVIDYRANPDWHLAVRDATEGRGVDRVVDVGGAGTLERSVRSAAWDAEVALVGALDTTSPMMDVRAISAGVVTIRRLAVGSRAQFLAMLRAIAAARMRPCIDRVFSFDEAPHAFRYFNDPAKFGKVVINHG